MPTKPAIAGIEAGPSTLGASAHLLAVATRAADWQLQLVDGDSLGQYPSLALAPDGQPAIAHYDGKSWRQVAHQKIGAPYLRLFLAVHGTSSTDVWAVGQQLGVGGSTGLIYHYQP